MGVERLRDVLVYRATRERFLSGHKDGSAMGAQVAQRLLADMELFGGGACSTAA
jgi:hypothetical protein